ncbi:MAG: hypothetical protein AVDCRST_MAG55-267, partial [uncultured Rubrobacteraceae bacterium]
ERGDDPGRAGGGGDSGAGGREHARHQVPRRGCPDRGLRPRHRRGGLRRGPLVPPRIHRTVRPLRFLLRRHRGFHTGRDRPRRRPGRARPDALARRRLPAHRRPPYRPNGRVRIGCRRLRTSPGARRGTGPGRRPNGGSRL